MSPFMSPERYSYTPYGEVTVLDADFSVDPNGTDIGNEYLYTGRRLDPETGLQINRRRIYDPPLGRWVNRDPIGYEGSGPNLYGYVLGRPTRFIDPWGLFIFGSRPLEGLPWLGWFSSNPIDDYFNTEISHEHGFYEEGSNDNVGLSPDGLFEENPDDFDYHYDDEHYDDDIMREAEENVDPGE